MPNQWIRDISLVVGKAGGQGIELRGLKIFFDILKTDTETPNRASLKIFNLTDETSLRIKEEFDTVILSAGYLDNIGLIYKGNITQVTRSRENAVDKVTHVVMGDGDEGYQFAMINKSLASGSTQQDILNEALKQLEPYGIEQGHIPEGLDQIKLPRGKTIFTNARDIIRNICRTTGSSWSIQDHKLNIIKLNKALPDAATLISTATGMVSPGPEQTIDGIKVKCLLNPEIKVGGKIKIEGDVQEMNPQGRKARKNPDKSPATIASDGVYRVVECRYFGDTYGGQDWYCDIVGVAMDASGAVTTDKFI